MFKDSIYDRLQQAKMRGREHFAKSHWGGGRGFGGWDGGIPSGRKFFSSDLQLVLLALLDRQPAHGYELIRALEEKSNGFYVPSPGVIYPALTYLEEIGHAAVEQDGIRKLYRLTDQGRVYLKTNRGAAEAMLNLLGRIGGRMEEVREAFAGVDEPDPDAADELHRARHDFKRALWHIRGAGPVEARRIAEILKRATAEIVGLSSKGGRP
jgi:DNA-binding PadR family transcriptional regulator